MFTISQIRAQARQTINSIPGIYYLPIIPVAMTFVMAIFQYLRPTVYLNNYDPSVSGINIAGSFFFPILYGLLVSFISISIAWTLLQAIRGTKKMVEIKDALAIFNSPYLGKIFVTYLVKQLYLFLWGLIAWIGIILSLGAFFALAIYAIFRYNSESSTSPDQTLAAFGIMLIIGLVVLIAGVILYIPQNLAYSQVEYILYDQLENNQYAGPNAIIKASRQMMKGYKGKRFVLDLSFIGWFLLQGITFGLAGIYVLPYYYAAQAHFYEAVKKDNQMKEAADFNQLNQATSTSNQVEKPTEEIPSPTPEKTPDFQESIEKTVETTENPFTEAKMDSAIDTPLDHHE
ncbi:integral membrane protein [Streptococcus varani]|uniref:Integral membrane protein n=1 Tax=Streptococcus varani TaxID=1608583 RepID=A0A0E4H3Z8_9STRE|nr:DUF975 family protein [Streptococcus varani]CQR24860.1 integral membrane protein [Streptococcus varani]